MPRREVTIQQVGFGQHPVNPHAVVGEMEGRHLTIRDRIDLPADFASHFDEQAGVVRLLAHVVMVPCH